MLKYILSINLSPPFLNLKAMHNSSYASNIQLELFTLAEVKFRNQFYRVVVD